MSYEFIEPLKERPKVEKKQYVKESMAEKIIKEFQKAKNLKYAKVPYNKISDVYKSAAYGARGMGRVVKRLGLEKELTVYSDSENIYLERSS